MEKFEIVVLPEVLNFIDKLPLILIQEGYLSTYENALRFAEDIISFMEQIPQSDSFQLEEIAKQHFSFLGDDLKYSLEIGLLLSMSQTIILKGSLSDEV